MMALRTGRPFWMVLGCLAVGAIVGCVVLVGAFLAPLVTAPLGGTLEIGPEEFTDSLKAHFEEQGAFKFPTSAGEMYGLDEGFQDSHLLVRFSIEAGDLPLLLETTLCEGMIAPVEPPAIAGSASQPWWWNPYDAQTLMECRGSAANRYQRILIDSTDPITYLVYIETTIQ